MPASAQIQTNPPVVISHVYGGGQGAAVGTPYTNDFVVLFNRSSTTQTLTNWSIQYGSSTGNIASAISISASIPAGRYFLIQTSGTGTVGASLPTPDLVSTSISMSATTAKVALVNSATPLGCGGATACNSTQLAQIVDLVGYGGAATLSEGSQAPGPTALSWLIRAGGGCTDTNTNSTDFSVTSSGVIPNSASAQNLCAGSSNPAGVGSATPNPVTSGNTTLIRVTVTPGSSPTSTGLAVTADLTNIGGSATQTLFDNGTNGDVTAGDNIFSFSYSVPGATSAGVKAIPFSIADAQTRSGSGTFNLTVSAPVSTYSINQIQGSGATSPLVGQTVQTSGIVTLRKSNGFYLQNPDASADSDPNTSEGILVFTSTAPPAAAAVGNLVQVTGTVTEFRATSTPAEDPNTLTELTSPIVTLLSTGNALPTPITLTSSSINPAAGFGQLEKYEGMRVTIASLTASGPTDGNVSEANATSTSNGRFYAVPTGVAKPFREPGIQIGVPLPIPGAPRWDGNLEIFEINFNMPGDTPVDVTSGAVVTNFVGVLDYFSPYYALYHDPSIAVSVSGLVSATPVSGAGPNELAVAAFNVERFFDTTNDPGTSDVVLTQTAFNNRLKKLSLAIRNVLKFPDVISLEEVENLTTLQAIATQIDTDAAAASQPVPSYTPFLFEGNDPGGIDVGFLIKQNVTVNSVTQLGLNTTYTDPTTNQQAIVFDRPPVVADVTAKLPASDSGVTLKILANHLRSLNGVDTQDASGNRIRVKRAAGAENVASILQSLQSTVGANVITLGDFNAFEFSDGYVDVMTTIKGVATNSSNVQVASPDLLTPDFINLMEDKLTAGVNRYSYNFVGSAQVLDHILVNQNLYPRVKRLEVARNDADFPEAYRNDPNRPERISDHDMPVVYIQLPNEVTSKTTVTKTTPAFNRATGQYQATIRVTNTSGSTLSGPIVVFVNGLSATTTLANAAGTFGGSPFVTGAPAGLAAGAFVDIPVRFTQTTPGVISYTTKVFAGSY